MKTHVMFLGGAVAAMLLAGGCGKSAQPEMSTSTPMTKPAMAPKVDPTHVVTKDQPYYLSMPMAGAKPAGMLKAGTKVLVLIPGSNAQVETLDGMTVYTSTDGLDALPMK